MGVVITTSRRPSPRTRSFIKDLVSVVPGSVRVTRGHMSMEELAREAVIRGADRVVVVGERRGNPGIIRVYRVEPGLRLRNTVSFIVRGVTLSREAGNGQPGLRRALLVESDGSEIADEVAEAFIIGFGARVGGPRGSIVASIRGAGDEALVEFSWRGRSVGPRIRLARPREMIKVGGGEGGYSALPGRA